MQTNMDWDKVKYDSLLNGIERAFTEEAQKADDASHQHLLNLTLRIVDHFRILYGDSGRIPDSHVRKLLSEHLACEN